ncbi:sensor histidine kinase [Geobacter pickeringii]|nr:ATP-binding protein [Geobacter pickeringii]
MSRAAGWAALVFFAFMAVGTLIVEQVEKTREHDRRQIVSQLAASSAYTLERQLSRSLSATYALASILHQYGEVRDFDELAREMIRTYGGISSLQLAPGGVIFNIYPLAGNEKAFGHDLLRDPQRRTEALKAIESRQLTLAGPVKLIQGGVGVIGRLPVFVRGGETGERFWGFATVLMRLEDLLVASNLAQLEQHGYAYDLARLNPDTTRWESFARSRRPLAAGPVNFVFDVPNGKWRLSMTPASGWRTSLVVALDYALLAIFSVAVTALIYILLRQPELLQVVVQKRTAELCESNRRLEDEIRQRTRAEKEVRRLNAELEQRVRERTSQLEVSNRELESFSYSVSHDLRAPLRHIEGYSRILLDDFGDRIGEEEKQYLERICRSSDRMKELIDNLLKLARFSRWDLQMKSVDLSSLARQVAEELQSEEPQRRVTFRIADKLTVFADAELIRIALENLLGNAWKYTGRTENAVIEFDAAESDGRRVFFVRDNGAGFEMKHADKLFGVFQRLHSATEFEGVGIGLATVQRIVQRHGGRIWAEGEMGKGATFYFTL